MEDGKYYDINIRFGTFDPWIGKAYVHHFGEIPSLVYDFYFKDEKTASFIDEFMKATNVRVFYSGTVIANLSLAGTYAAVQEMASCQEAMLNGEPRQKKDPFSSTPKSDPFE